MSDFANWIRELLGPDIKARSADEPLSSLQLPPEDTYKRLEAKAIRLYDGEMDAEGAKRELLTWANFAILRGEGDIWAWVELFLDDTWNKRPAPRHPIKADRGVPVTPAPPPKPPRLTVVEARLLAILEADRGWLDRQAIGHRHPSAATLAKVHLAALKRLVERGLIESEKRPGPRGNSRYYYRYVPRT